MRRVVQITGLACIACMMLLVLLCALAACLQFMVPYPIRIEFWSGLVHAMDIPVPSHYASTGTDIYPPWALAQGGVAPLIPAIALLSCCFLCLCALLALVWRGRHARRAGRAEDKEETTLMQQLYRQGLLMEERIGSLETILISRTSFGNRVRSYAAPVTGRD